MPCITLKWCNLNSPLIYCGLWNFVTLYLNSFIENLQICPMCDQTMRFSFCPQTCSKVLEALRDGEDFGECEAQAEDYMVRCRARFPYAQIFRPPVPASSESSSPVSASADLSNNHENYINWWGCNTPPPPCPPSTASPLLSTCHFKRL